jgi:hypothetical protein
VLDELAIRRLDGEYRQLGEFRCSSCGYGVSVLQTPDACPMCREADWVPIPRWADVADKSGLPLVALPDSSLFSR